MEELKPGIYTGKPLEELTRKEQRERLELLANIRAEAVEMGEKYDEEIREAERRLPPWCLLIPYKKSA